MQCRLSSDVRHEYPLADNARRQETHDHNRVARGSRRILTLIIPCLGSSVVVIIYMSITCRPDISTWVSKAARGMHDPQENHLYLAHRLIMYLHGTQHRGLEFCCESPIAEFLT